MPKPRLSILTPTFNRKDLLIALLDALNDLRAAPGEVEVVVIDNGSTDRTLEALVGRRDRYLLRTLREETSLGPAGGRNRGARIAEGEIFGFLDSDVIPHPDWWIKAEPHFADPAVAAVEGRTVLPPHSLRPTPFTNFVHNVKGGSFLNCNFLVRAADFHAVGGLDERFVEPAGRGLLLYQREDTDFAFTLFERGRRIVFEPEAVVYHPLPKPNYQMHFRWAGFGPHDALLRRKHPRLYRTRLKWIDGRMFPAFYWGIFIGLPGTALGLAAGSGWLATAAAAAFTAGWVGAAYALCRGRQTSSTDALRLLAQLVVIPWLRLASVLHGILKYRRVKPNPDGGASQEGR